MWTEVDVTVHVLAHIIRNVIQLGVTEKLVMPHAASRLRRNAEILPGLMPPEVRDHGSALYITEMMRPELSDTVTSLMGPTSLGNTGGSTSSIRIHFRPTRLNCVQRLSRH